MPNEVRFDIKMIDIKVDSNVSNSKQFSLTSDMFNFTINKISTDF